MSEELRNIVATFPKKPGVYLMRDGGGEVIYVGKAKDLRARVRTYFAGGDGRSQIEFLLKRIVSIEKIVTEGEHQAFVLERDLINKYKPRYNIRLKDDKSYLNVRIDSESEWPRLELVRKVQTDGARYFGPYAFTYELYNLLDIIKRVVPLRTCTDTVFYNRQRPCLEYQIKRCAGPCCLEVNNTEYRSWVKQAISILEGRTDNLRTEYEKRMEAASTELRFEEAALFRDRLLVLESFAKGQKFISSRAESRDVFGLYRVEGLVAVSILIVRLGRISDSISYAFTDVSVPDEEILESVLGQFYVVGRELPEEIVIPFELQNLSLIQAAISREDQTQTEFIVPERGIKHRLVKLAELNAQEHFTSRFNSEAKYLEVSQALARQFKLKQVPRKIECADISNFQGSDIVGAIVAFYDGQPDKASYRKFKISFQDKPDDFAAMHEVVTRRLKAGKENGDMPDLLIIDGGPGQLAKALEARDQVGVQLEIVSLAKMRTLSAPSAKEISKIPERIYIEGNELPVELKEESEVTKFVQRVRDEAHRFVIGFHRNTRSKRVFKSKLDDILGLGPERRRRLLKEFGSVEAIAKASAEDVARAGRMPKPLAEKVLRVLSNISS